MKPTVSWDSFAALEIRVGTITQAHHFPEALKPAYKLLIDFGDETGILRSSAQLTENYAICDLLDKQVLAVVNLAPKQIGPFLSQCLVLGLYTPGGVVLVSPGQVVKNGCQLG